MNAHEYLPGGWTALVTGDALALLPPTVPEDVARELWQLSAGGARLSAWVEYLAAAGIATLPAFAMVEAHPEGLRVLVRGEAEVEQDGRVVSGRGLTTWREELLPAADVTVRAQSTGGGWLPVTGGIVRAAAARLLTSPQEAPAPLDEEEDVELTVARMPALAAAVGVRPAADAAFAPSGPAAPAPAVDPLPPTPAPTGPGPDDVAPVRAEPPAPPVPAPAPPEPTPPLEPTPPPAPPVPASPAPVPPAAADTAATADEPDEESEQAPADVVAPAPPAPAAEAEEEPEDSDDYDFLLWSTEQVRAHRSEEPAPPAVEETGEDPGEEAREEPAPPAHEAGAPDLEATRLPEPEEDAPGTVEPGGIIDSVPGLSRPAAPVGAPVDLPPPAADPGDDGDHDGETIATSHVPVTPAPVAPEPAPRPAPGVELVLSTGPRIEMDRPVLLGRAPEATRFAGTEVPRLVRVSNPERDISSTHVEVRPAGGHVVVTDMNSTNGTVLHLPDQPSFRLQPGTGVPVGPGAVIELGAGVEITVQRVEGAQ